ncbi:hypothetical protein [Cohnella silvisoli]|uniref:Alpha-L-rhamnosidase six-hairpin glycosidase domain-containing protein n=1 Tax=Cohnella silvisoli TaxID=2873699 RepID=A0ABV1KPK5_9BACL|nr:hypothetical protein [Cohnella silvisoli]MCD9020260.1 hypothetical protein [Cohnella silvisoli]
MAQKKFLWHPDLPNEPDTYVWFFAEAFVSSAEICKLRVFGKDFYRVYVNGEERLEGPARYTPAYPEYDEISVACEGGRLSIAVIVHHIGVDTRIALADLPPFLMCELSGPQGAVDLQWTCKRIIAYRRTGRRINGQLGWAEYCDTKLLPQPESAAGYNDGGVQAVEVEVPLGELRPKTIADCRRLKVAGQRLTDGVYANRFGYADDDMPIRFMLRDLQPREHSEGAWIRFDFQNIGLYRPRITIEVPAGTVVEAGYCESLTDNRVCPVIPLSASMSCNMDRWVTSGGVQTLQTFSPRGFRYLEIHIACPLEQIRIVEAEADQRTYFDRPTGAFSCNDERLNRIWQLGVESLLACSEDAVTDNPTRERGQWLGDAAVVGIETLSVSFDDYALIRRSLQQAAYCAREDGFVSGLYPGQPSFLTGSALMWVDGCMRYFRLTGDRSLLTELYDCARKTIDLFLRHLTPSGVIGIDAWDFIDWGHVVAADEINVALNLMLLRTLRDLKDWEKEIGVNWQDNRIGESIRMLDKIIRSEYFNADGLLAKAVPAHSAQRSNAAAVSSESSLHANVFALSLHLLDEEGQKRVAAGVKEHYSNSFPNRSDAPRLSEPAVSQAQLITPFFSHYALDALWEAGEDEFVLNQYRTCWGWMLDQGLTTPSEVFDLRWSHCHLFSSCPTWQLSRHVLGLLPDRSGDPLAFRLHPKFGDLAEATGRFPIPGNEGTIRVEWQRVDGRSVLYRLQTDVPIRIQLSARLNLSLCELDGQAATDLFEVMHINKELTFRFDIE